MTKRIKQSIEYFRSNGSPFEWKLELLNSEYQTTPYSRSDRPNPDMVRYYVDNKWSEYQFEEDTLNLIFNRFNDIHDRQHLFARFLALDSIYSTQLDTGKMISLAGCLISHTQNTCFDEYIPGLVEEIRADFKAIYRYDPYSFVSKYFSHLNEMAYPIYDSYVKTMLLWYKYTFADFDFDADDLDNYDSFRTILAYFIRLFNLNCNLRTADKFLWTAGKEFFPRYVYKDLIAKYKPARHQNPG